MIPKWYVCSCPNSRLLIILLFNCYIVKSKSQISASLSLLSLFLIAFMMFPIGDAYSFKIHCADDIDLEEYPLCQYETEWNESEKFNELVVNGLKERSDEINADPSSFDKIYSEIQTQVDRDNPGLYEKGIEIKNWIYEQLEK